MSLVANFFKDRQLAYAWFKKFIAILLLGDSSSVVVVLRKNNYYFPPETECFAKLNAAYPDAVHLVWKAAEFGVFHVLHISLRLGNTVSEMAMEGSTRTTTEMEANC
jgi:hypothetical protein